jgi:hypothetical protein
MSPAKWLNEAQYVVSRLAASVLHTAPQIQVREMLPYILGSPLFIKMLRTDSGAVHVFVAAGAAPMIERKRVIAGKPDRHAINKAALRLARQTAMEFCFLSSFGK